MTQASSVYVVAGAGSGLGSALVTTLASTGGTTVAIARRRTNLEKLEQLAHARSWSFRAIAADLTVQSEANAAVEAVIHEFGRVDGVAITAGRWIVGSSMIHETSDAEWTDGLASNLGPLVCTARAVLPTMLQHRRGSLVLTAASEAVRWAGTASYCAAKGAIIDLGRKLAHDYRPFGVRANVVLPGNMASSVDPGAPPGPQVAAPLTDDVPTSPWEVARVITLLLSEEGRWITGATVTVDGGRSTWAPAQS